MPDSPAYASFLVRLWRVGDHTSSSPLSDLLGEIECIQTNQRSTFHSLDEMFRLLRRQAEEARVLWPEIDE